MDLDGELTVRLEVRERHVRRATVLSTRPFATSRALAGRGAREAAAMVPLLHAVCGQAQGSAAASALACAEGRAPDGDVLAARSLAVALEAVQEDLRRLLVDLPDALGATPAVEPAANARRAIAPMLAALRPALALDAEGPFVAAEDIAALGARLATIVDEHVRGCAARTLAGLGSAEAILAWTSATTAPARVVRAVLDDLPSLGASDVPTVPAADAGALDEAVLASLAADRSYARAPRWHGAVMETGALARCRDHPGVAAFVARHGNGVAARIVARCIDLGRTVGALADGRVPARVIAWSPRAGEGAAAVEAARGLLLHRSRVAGGRVQEHAIVAPTEWNFHPDGALARGLAGLPADDDDALVRRARLVAQSLDPCVACIVEVAHA